MASEWAYLKDRKGDKGPNSAGFGDGSSSNSGRADVLRIVTRDRLYDVLPTLIATSTPGEKTPRLKRTLPVAHPQFPWLFADGITGISGVSPTESTDADPDGILEAEPLPTYMEYEEYEVRIQFTSRRYSITSDEAIPTRTLNYYDDNDDAQVKQIAEEWTRFVEKEYGPSGEYITAQQGQFTFRSDPNPTINEGPQNGSTVPGGTIRIFVNSRQIRYRWYAVPLAYLESTNNYFDQVMGHVNQLEFDGYPAGTLLLTGVQPLRIYTPPFPEFVPYTGFLQPSQEKLCDIELHVIYKEPPLGATGNPTRNGSIAYGHNLVPYALTRKFYYVETQGSGQNAQPIYPSLPFELLFQNPDMS